MFGGGWLENGDVFDDWQHAGFRSNGGAGVVMDTLVDPLSSAARGASTDDGARTWPLDEFSVDRAGRCLRRFGIEGAASASSRGLRV